MRTTTSPEFDAAFHAWRHLPFPKGGTDPDLAYVDSMIAGTLITLHDKQRFVEPSAVENWNERMTRTIQTVIDRWTSALHGQTTVDKQNAEGTLRYALLLRDAWSYYLDLEEAAG